MPSCTVLREYFLVLEYGYCMDNFNDVQNILASTQNDVLSMHIMHITRVCILASIILLILESITSYSRNIYTGPMHFFCLTKY